jgi:hypothetical protein
MQTLSELMQHYPEKVMALIYQKGFMDKEINAHPAILRDRNIPLYSAIREENLEMTKRLLTFERAHSAHQGRWSSRQLSSLSLCDIISNTRHTEMLPILTTLFAFEASQTGAHFPPRPNQPWTSTLAQQSHEDWPIPLIYAAEYANRSIVSLLLHVGAKSPPNEIPSALSKALSRYDKAGPGVVLSLIAKGSTVCGEASNDQWVAFLGREASKREVFFLLQMRPDLARKQSSEGKTALMVAGESEIRLGEDDEVHTKIRRKNLAMMESLGREPTE